MTKSIPRLCRKEPIPNKAITGYFPNGDKIEFFDDGEVTLDDLRVAASNVLNPMRFAPEIVVLKSGRKLLHGDMIMEAGDLQLVVIEDKEKDEHFWMDAVDAHLSVRDIHGVERAVAAMPSYIRNILLTLFTRDRILWPRPFGKHNAMKLLYKNDARIQGKYDNVHKNSSFMANKVPSKWVVH